MNDEIREYLVSKATPYIDANPKLARSIQQAAIDAVRNDMGTGWDRDDFVMMLAGRGQTDRREVADVIGIAVREVIREWRGKDDPMYLKLIGLLDLDDRGLTTMLGEHYMPGEQDWPEDDDQQAPKIRTWTVTWTEISNHRREIDEDQMQTITGMDADELTEAYENDDLDGELANGLAELNDDGFEGLTREDIEVEVG